MRSAPRTGGGEQSGSRPVIMFVEDDADLVAMSATYLERAGFDVVTASGARGGLEMLARTSVDLLVLDLGLPDGNGLDLLRSLRAGPQGDLPVIVVTGRGEEADRVVGLELGADDYMVKPFSQRELVARIRAVLRRIRPSASGVIHLGELLIDTGARAIRAAGKPIALTPLEYGLLEFLAATPGRTFSREQLLLRVWDSSGQWQDPGTVAEHVYRIRRKLAEAAVSEPRIITVRGYGYRLDL